MQIYEYTHLYVYTEALFFGGGWEEIELENDTKK